MTDMRMFEHKGWKLATAFDDKEPRIKDVELGERLKYSRPIRIRQVIQELVKSGKLKDVLFVTDAVKNPEGRGRPGKAFYLTEVQAVIVITNSGTPTANALTQEIAEVFVAWRHGRLGGVDEQRIAALMDSKIAGALTAMQELVMRLLRERSAPAANDTMEQRITARIDAGLEELRIASGYVASFTPVHGIISGRSYNEMCALRDRIAEIEGEIAVLSGAANKPLAVKRARSSVQNEIKRISMHGYRPGDRLCHMSARHEHDVFKALREREARALDELEKAKCSRQQRIDFSHN